MSTFIKICGICSRSDLEQICVLKPDALGFVFWEKSKRYVRPAQVATWLPSIPDGIKKVGVFVEPLADVAEEIARECSLDIIQIHQRSASWKIDRSLFHGLETWLSPKMEDGVSSVILNAVRPEPSVLLADSFDSKTIGGTGKISNWDAAIKMREALKKPLLLAGGLNYKNVGEAIREVNPWGVDVSSGVEKKPGVKDMVKVKNFINAVRMPA